MVVIRLARTGAKKRPFYHVVAADDRRCRSTGRYIERLGYFNPLERDPDKALRIQAERVQHWLSCGAQPSDRVRQLLRQSGCLAG
jgi:small subunit ribosomal protein S16